jgi:hypothetical protein
VLGISYHTLDSYLRYKSKASGVCHALPDNDPHRAQVAITPRES